MQKVEPTTDELDMDSFGLALEDIVVHVLTSVGPVFRTRSLAAARAPAATCRAADRA